MGMEHNTRTSSAHQVVVLFRRLAYVFPQLHEQLVRACSGAFELAEVDDDVADSLTFIAAAAGVFAKKTLPDITELANHIAIWCANPASARPLKT